jgi:hypothetical protein
MKKAIVEYYNELPVALKDLKEFKDDNSYKAFEALCKTNKAKKDKADEEAVAVAVAREKEAVKRLNRRVAWIALLWTEMELDHGSLTLTDEEYTSFKENFNLGDVKDLDTMPSPFIAVYDMLKEDL